MRDGSKSWPETCVMFTVMGQETWDGMKPVFIRSSRVASIFGDIITLQDDAPYRWTQSLQEPRQLVEVQGIPYSWSRLYPPQEA